MPFIRKHYSLSPLSSLCISWPSPTLPRKPHRPSVLHVRSSRFSFSAVRHTFALCRLLKANLCRWSSENPHGSLPLQYLLSRRSPIVIRSDCDAAQRWPMITHPTILMLIACRLRVASNRRASHSELLSLGIRAITAAGDLLCNKDRRKSDQSTRNGWNECLFS